MPVFGTSEDRGSRHAPRCRDRGRFDGRILLLLLAALAWSCAPPPHGPADRAPVVLTLLHTTDFHGALESESTDRETGRPIGGAAYLAAMIDRERATNPEGTLVLDSGDIYQGTALSNLTEGRASIAYMNEAGFDAAAVGNHEFDFGIETLEARIAQASFPLLCANVIERGQGAAPSWGEPYAILTRAGVRVAVIGLITPDTPNVTLPQNVAHLEFLDPITVANEWIEELVPAQADLAVIVCHIGGSQDEDGSIEGDLVELAQDIEGESAILAGHTHQVVAGRIDDTAVVQSGSNGRWLGRIDLTWDPNQSRVVSSTSQIMTVFAGGSAADAMAPEPEKSTDADSGGFGRGEQDSVGDRSVAPDPEVMELIAEHRAAIAPILDEQIATAAADLLFEPDAECPIGNWTSDVMREAAEAEIAFQNPGGVRASIAAGPIRYADVYRAMPFDNTIFVAEMSGADVRDYLEAAGVRGSFLHVSGLHYRIDYTRPPGNRVSSLHLEDGSHLEPARIYRIAVNSFMAQGGDDLPVLLGRPGAHDSGVFVREALASACRAATASNRSISAAIEGRVVQAP